MAVSEYIHFEVWRVACPTTTTTPEHHHHLGADHNGQVRGEWPLAFRLAAVMRCHQGESRPTVAAELGVAPHIVRGWCERYPVNEPRPLRTLLERGPRDDVEEACLDAYIRRCCRRLQAGWTPSQERLRRGGSEPAYSFPCYRGGGMGDDGVMPLDGMPIECDGDRFG